MHLCIGTLLNENSYYQGYEQWEKTIKIEYPASITCPNQTSKTQAGRIQVELSISKLVLVSQASQLSPIICSQYLFGMSLPIVHIPGYYYIGFWDQFFNLLKFECLDTSYCLQKL